MTKPTLLLLHGALGAKNQFEPWLAHLQPHFDVHLLNFEGHGGVQTQRPYDIAHFAENVLTYCQAQNLEKVNIFGYSMGGYVALYLAQHYPQQVHQIFTFATKLAWTPETAQKEVKLLDAATIRSKVPAFATQLAERHAPLDWEAVLSATATLMVSLGNAPLITPENVANIPHAIRMGVGDKDVMVSIEETVAIYRALPNASLLVLPKTLHPIEKINVTRITQEIISFFDNETKG